MDGEHGGKWRFREIMGEGRTGEQVKCNSGSGEGRSPGVREECKK